jgi:hypothetical protein
MRGKPGEIRIRGEEIGGDGAEFSSLTFVTQIDFGNSKLKTRTLALRGGIIHTVSAESSWTTST